MLAIDNQHEETAQVLMAPTIQASAQNMKDKVNHRNAMMLASIDGRKALVKNLMQVSANPGAIDKNGQTSLMLALINEHAETAELLVADTAKASALDLEDRNGNTALIYACKLNFLKCIKLLLSAGCSVFRPMEKTKSGGVPKAFQWAIVHQNKAGVKALMGKMSSEEQHLALCLMLLEEAQGRGDGVLDPCNDQSQYNRFQFLLEMGAPVDGRELGDAYKTAMMLASEKGLQQNVETLLAHDADPSLTDTYEFTALMLAVKNGHEATARVLIQKTAAVTGAINVKACCDVPRYSDLSECHGRTALMLAIKLGFTDLVHLLLSAGADAEEPDPHGRTR